MFSIEIVESVALVKLNHGITNAINLELISKLAEILERLKNSPDVRGVLLGSANEKFFSIGFDIPNLFGLGKGDFGVFYRVFNQTCMDLYTFPKPTIAAISGHAIAGGTILTLCCDYRFIAQGHKLMGLNEIKLGVPVPFIADCILRSLVGLHAAREILQIGEFYTPDESLKIGLVDKILPLGQVEKNAIERAKSLGAMDQNAFEQIKRNLTEDIQDKVEARWHEKEKNFIDCWYSETARGKLKAAIEKF